VKSSMSVWVTKNIKQFLGCCGQSTWYVSQQYTCCASQQSTSCESQQYTSCVSQQYTRWFKYDRDKLWLVYTQISPGHIWTTLYMLCVSAIYILCVSTIYEMCVSTINMRNISTICMLCVSTIYMLCISTTKTVKDWIILTACVACLKF
jgi:hypothetical protein